VCVKFGFRIDFTFICLFEKQADDDTVLYS